MNTFSVTYQEIMNQFNNRCIIDLRPAVTLHEIEPKSQRPRDWQEEENRVPVCVDCHERIHRDGAKVWKEELTILRKKRIDEKYQ